MKPFDREQFIRDVRQILGRLCGVAPGDIRLEADLRDDLGLDSLRSMELLSRLSERWDVSLTMEDAVGARTVSDLVELMARFVTEEAQGGGDAEQVP